MKLYTKLILFNTISKLGIVLVFIVLLPVIIHHISLAYTDSKLNKQKDKILQIIKSSGIQNYIQKGESYGSYTPLKEEYISLDEAPLTQSAGQIKNDRRIIEKDTIEYRILSQTFQVKNKNYLLEIGKSVNSIGEITSPLQNIGLLILLGIISLTILADLAYSKYILRPLNWIINTKLINSSFPRQGSIEKVKTTTSDFLYLDSSIQGMMETIEKRFLEERQLISNTSHELLTPISILQSKIENLFSHEQTDPQTRIRLEGMQKIVHRLKVTIRTLLFISQIENEQFEKNDTISMRALTEEVYEEISIRLEELFISMEIQVPESWVLTGINKVLFFNLLFNLVNNAIKYNTSRGRVLVKGALENGMYTLEVIDTGIGIPAKDLDTIFNRFKNKKPAKEDSFGLGLPIVKTIADFHHIRISVESTEGKGSRFLLIFPDGMIISEISS